MTLYSEVDAEDYFDSLAIALLQKKGNARFPNDEEGGTLSRYALRRKYWQQLLPVLQKMGLFTAISPTKDYWLSKGAGISGLSYTVVVTGSHVRIELSIIASSKERNKQYFDTLFNNKERIETAFGNPLVWERLSDNKMSRIKYQLDGVSLFNDEDWPAMNSFFVTYLPTFERAFKGGILALKQV